MAKKRAANRGRKWVVKLPGDDPRTVGSFRRYGSYVPVASFYSLGNYLTALVWAQSQFGDSAVVDEFVLPSGYKVAAMHRYFFTKCSRYGQKYLCACCRRETLGMTWGGARMHWPGCPYWVAT